MYLISELVNTITGYEMMYNANKTIGFKQFYLSGIFGEGKKVPEQVTAAEILISPDHKFLVATSRGDNTFSIPNFDPKNDTKIPSDTVNTFAIDHSTGNLTYVQQFPSGGRFPRQYSFNKAGDLLGVGLQQDGRVVVIDRDISTGMLKSFVAHADIAGEVTSVVFDE